MPLHKSLLLKLYLERSYACQEISLLQTLQINTMNSWNVFLQQHMHHMSCNIMIPKNVHIRASNPKKLFARFHLRSAPQTNLYTNIQRSFFLIERGDKVFTIVVCPLSWVAKKVSFFFFFFNKGRTSRQLAWQYLAAWVQRISPFLNSTIPSFSF